MPKGKSKRVTCEECFFHQNMLCALQDKRPCPTFRPELQSEQHSQVACWLYHPFPVNAGVVA